MVLTVCHNRGETNPLSRFGAFNGNTELLMSTVKQCDEPLKGAHIQIGTRANGPVVALFPTGHLNMMTYGAYDKKKFNVSNPHNLYESKRNTVIGTVTKLQKSMTTTDAPRYAVYLADHSYTLYPIDMGKEGLKMPVYNDMGEQVASITRPYSKDKHELNYYFLYLVDMRYALIAMTFITYIDAMEYVDKAAALPSISLARNSRELYNPDFEKYASTAQ